jgi:hypothetical protein
MAGQDEGRRHNRAAEQAEVVVAENKGRAHKHTRSKPSRDRNRLVLRLFELRLQTRLRKE